MNDKERMAKHANIVLITTDQHRKDALGCYGNEIIDTPNIDGLAARGVRFDRMFTAYPVCAPNRASIITGRYPSVHRLRQNGMRLPESELTLMELLRRSGFRTYGAGKMHFGPQWEFPADGRPIRDPDPSTAIDPQPDAFPWYGFEETHLTEDHRIGPYSRHLAKHGYDLRDEMHSASFPQSATVASPIPEEHHQTTWITNKSIDFLESPPSDEPFFLWTSYVHPHHPFNPPKPYDETYVSAEMPLPIWDPAEPDMWPDAYLQKYTLQGSGHEAVGLDGFTDDDWRRIKAYYYGMISQIDANVGRIIETLEKRGLLENTIIVFTADHGEMLGDHHLLFKGTTYDCITNVPCIIAAPRIPGSGESRNVLASSIDIMPTLLDLSGVGTPEANPIQGASLVPAFSGDSICIRDALLIENSGARRSIRTETDLLTWHGEDVRGELYDLERDPDCLRNLWDDPAAAGKRQALVDRLVDLMSRNVDPLPVQEGPW